MFYVQKVYVHEQKVFLLQNIDQIQAKVFESL